MKKSLAIVLALILTFAGAAFAQPTGNLNNGAFVDSAFGGTYVFDGSDLLKIDETGATVIGTGDFYRIQAAGDRLYYVERTFENDEYDSVIQTGQTAMSCLPDGSDKVVIGEKKDVGEYYDSEEYVCDRYVGYDCFTVYGDRIYYLGNNGSSGEYQCNIKTYDENDKPITLSATVRYNDAISLYSMALDGSDTKEVIKNVGNAPCYFAIEDDKIYLAGCYTDMLYAYYYTNFGVYGLDGELIKSYPGYPDDEKSYFSDSGNYYVIPDGCQASSGNMYVGVEYSEGDFRSSELFKLEDSGEMTPELIQDSTVKSVIIGENAYYLASDSDNIFYDWDYDYDKTLGIYVKKLGDEGIGTKLAPITSDTAFTTEINVVGEYVYYKDAQTGVCRVPTTGGDVETLTENGFKAQ